MMSAAEIFYVQRFAQKIGEYPVTIQVSLSARCSGAELHLNPRVTAPKCVESAFCVHRIACRCERSEQWHQDESGEVITDSCLKIQSKLYHIECQSTDDTEMAVRMIEYDFHIAMEHLEKEGRVYRMEFPKSCVLYIRSGSAIPEFLKVKLILPDEKEVLYRIPTIQCQSYKLEEIFQKRLFIFLPNYIMRYEKQKKLLEQDKKKLRELLEEYAEMRKRMEETLLVKNNSGLYMDLCKLILRITNYIFDMEQSSAGKGIGDIMGGKVLELYTEERYREGMEKGMEKGVLKTLADLVADGMLTIAQAAQRAGMSVSEFQERTERIAKL